MDGIDVIVGSDAADAIRIALSALNANALGLLGIDAPPSATATGTDAVPPRPARLTMVRLPKLISSRPAATSSS